MDRELAECLGRASELIFLCSGNMVRSAFAELYARHLDCPLPVRSAATIYRNDHLFPETLQALLARGVALEELMRFRPTHLADVVETLDARTLALGMSRHHLGVLRSVRGWCGRSFLLAQALGREEEIADPVLEGADFEHTFAAVARCVETIVARLR